VSKSSSNVLIIAGAASLLTLLCLALLPGAIALVWTPNCDTCHEDIAQSQRHFPHAEQSCISCHGGTTRAQRLSYQMTVMYQMRLPVWPFQADTLGISNTHCQSCHESDRASGVTVSRGIRIDHSVCTAQIRCTVCHAGIGHELADSWTSRYSMNQCLRCHQSKSVYSEEGCEQCHEGRHQPLTEAAPSSFALVHGANWEQTHGLGDIQTCAACHDSTMCARCHGELVPHDSRTVVSQHGRVAIDPGNQCDTCHRDASFCDGCHGIDMPHPSGFLQEHSAITRRLTREVCNRCHLPDDCNACHSAHVHPGGATP